MKYLQFKMEGVDDQGIFTGHASVFNVVDLDGDVVEPGAFAETLATGAASAGVLIFGQHEDRKEPLGRTLELREDSGAIGHNYKVRLNSEILGAIIDDMDLTVENAVFDNAYLIVYRPDKLPLLVCMAVMAARELARDKEGAVTNQM